MSKKSQKIGSDPKSTMSSNGGTTVAKAGAAPATTSPPANAWAQPLRPKSNVAQGPPPGMGKGKSQSGSNGGGGGGGGGNTSNQNALRERFIGLSLNMVGQKVVVTQTNGAVFEGIFHTFCPFASLPASTKNKYVIKACRVVKPPQTEDAKSSNQVVDQSTVIISADKVACLTVKSMRIDTMSASTNGNSQKKSADGFRTDTEISGGTDGRSLDLVAAGTAWTAGGGTSRADALMGGLDEKDKGARKKPNTNSGLGGNIGEWDQFRANKELFNVNATYDENLYTTELDKSQIDKGKLAAAERLAREIENTTSSNIHIAQERGHRLEGDYDEEDLYSGVLSKDSVKAVAPASKSKAENQEKAKNDNHKSSSAAPKKMMNYAAAAAKADLAKKKGPPGFVPNSKETKDATENENEEGDTEAEASKDAPAVEQPKKEESSEAPSKAKPEETKEEAKAQQKAPETQTKEVSKEPKAKPKAESADNGKAAAAAAETASSEDKAAADKEKAASKMSSKLNANAKSFTLKATAKAFTPGGVSAPGPAAPDAQFVDPNAAVHVGQVASHMAGPQYHMHGAPMGQPGMMPMMNPQFPGGVRYPTGYGMDQQHSMPQMQPQPQHVNPPAHGSGAPSPGPASVDENVSQAQPPEGDPAAAAPAPASVPQQQPQQPGQPPQQQVPVPYGVPPGPYYAGQMAMHPRGPGGPHPGYHPQFVGAPQQMVGPGGTPYRHMYPMNQGGMPPNVQVRGPAAPYYAGPVGPVPYPPNAYVGHGMMEEDSGFRGGQRGGGGRGRGGGGGGRRGRGRGGRGRGGYNAYHQHGGRQGQQNQNGPPENWSGADGGGGAQAEGGGMTGPGPSGANQSGKPGDKAAKQ